MPPDLSADRPDLDRLITAAVDPDWYKVRYPDVAASGLDPLLHFLRFGQAERRNPNRFFDCEWYLEHHADVAASGLDPLVHYLQSGATELRNPHPRFDASFYVRRYPQAAANPMLFHLRIGVARGYLTEQPVDIRDYLSSSHRALELTHRVFADVVIPLCTASTSVRRCLQSVLADRGLPLARITVVEDVSLGKELTAWLGKLAADGQINLIRNRRPLGVEACVRLGIAAAETHDVVVVREDAEVAAGWLRRLAAHAWAEAAVATVVPLTGGSSTHDTPRQTLADFNLPVAAVDAACLEVNAGRFVALPPSEAVCRYIRRDALRAVGGFGQKNGSVATFAARASAAGWLHRLACDIFVGCDGTDVSALGSQQAPVLTSRPGPARGNALTDPSDAFRFAAGAAIMRHSGLPVILMVSHDLGGGVGRHINSLAARYHGQAHVLLLEGTDRGAVLSMPGEPLQPLLKLPSDRIDDLVQVLRSANVTRVHVHHLLHMDMDIRRLIHRLGVPFDVTVHDYFAICPQINLLRWPESPYCNEPGPAGCNACIAARNSHGAKEIVSWRQKYAWQFHEAQRVICPSDDVRMRLARYGLANKAVVAPHEIHAGTHWPIVRPTFAKPPLRIVLLGVLANHKGARLVASVAQAASSGTLDIRLVGHLEDDFPVPAVKLIKTTGSYREDELDDLLRRTRPHVFWLPSSAPETYSYALSTAIASGLPIVATALGSFPERLAGRPNTWLVDHRASAAHYLDVFKAVGARLRDLNPVRKAARQAPPADFYAAHYLPPTQASQPAARPSRLPRSRPRIVVVPERLANRAPTPSAYIRLLLPLDHPAIGHGFAVTLADPETVFDYQADIIATHRLAIPDLQTAERLAAHAKRIGAKLLYDLDDDLLNVPLHHPEARHVRQAGKLLRRMLTAADAVWLSTQALADRLVAQRPDARVLVNRLDERIWTRHLQAEPWRGDRLRILCMGTSAHARDFELIAPVLLRLKADYGDRIAVDVLGMTGLTELPPGLNRIGPSPHGTRSYPGFVDWLHSVQPGWQIGLAPLLDDGFNRGKSPIKALDYAALGLATLASDVPAYQHSIADGVGGQLVRNDPAHWHTTLDWLIRDHTRRRSLAMRGHQAFLQDGTLHNHAGPRRQAWESLLADQQPADAGGLRPASAGLTMTHA